MRLFLHVIIEMDILSKKIDENINHIEEIKNLKHIVNNIEKADEFSKQIKQCENKFKDVLKSINEIKFKIANTYLKHKQN